MDMTNVERVIKAIENRGFTITQYPFKALIDMYDRELKFVGTVLSFEYRSSLGVHEHTIFIMIRKIVTYFIMDFHY